LVAGGAWSLMRPGSTPRPIRIGADWIDGDTMGDTYRRRWLRDLSFAMGRW